MIREQQRQLPFTFNSALSPGEEERLAHEAAVAAARTKWKAENKANALKEAHSAMAMLNRKQIEELYSQFQSSRSTHAN